jgi:hypothetical protein
MSVLKTVSEGSHPELGLVVQVEQLTTSGEWATTTGMTRLDATTGLSQSTVMFRGPVLNVVEVDVPTAHQSIQSGIGKKMIGMVDHNNNVRATLFHRPLPIY